MVYLRTGMCLFLLFSPWVLAEDIARDIRNSNGAPNDTDGGYFELGIGAAYIADPYLGEHEDCDNPQVCPTLYISGAYRYKSAFLEFADGTYDGINLGYNLVDNQHWAVDFIALNVFGEFDTEDKHSDDPQRQKELDLMYRSRLLLGAGTRITRYFDNAIVQFRALGDLTGHGFASSLRLGQSLQVRNWNFHGVVSMDWLSAKASNYWIGIAPDEATIHLPPYNTHDSVYVSGELGLTYPITTHWVGRAYVRYIDLPKNVYSSPLIDKNHASIIAAAVCYAF